MMHGFNNSMYEGWSPFFTYNTPQELELSEKLPIPNEMTYEFSNDINNSIDVKPFVQKLNTTKYLPQIDLVFLLNLVKNNNKIYYNPENELEKISYNRLLVLINKHNGWKYSSEALKNFVVKNIIETSKSPKNQVSSYSPINNDKYTQIKEKLNNNFTLMLGDGISMDQQQQSNGVGKEVISIAANGIKDYFSLVDYFTSYYSGEINNIDNKYFEREFTIEFTKNPVNKKITKQKTVKVNRIAGLKLQKEAIAVLNNKIGNVLTTQSGELGEEMSEIQKKIDLHNLFSYDKDPSLVLSSLLSSATDNAKELIVKAINAGTEFAAMHVYLIILGFDEGKVAEFMIGEDATKILKGLEGNIFTDSRNPKTVDELVNSSGISNEFKKIYNLAKELTFIAKILKINKGLRADAYELYTYFKNIEEEFVNRNTQFIKDTKSVEEAKETNKLQEFKLRVLQDKPYLGVDPNYITKTILNAVDSKILSEDFKFKDFSIDKFFNDPEYRNIAINYYNLIKGTFNVLDLMTNLDHYWNVIVASKMVLDQIKDVSSKFSWITEQLPDLLVDAKKENNIRSSESKFTIEGTSKDKFNNNQLKNALNTFDDIVISSFINSELSLTPIDMFKVAKDLNKNVIKYEGGKFRTVQSGDMITFDSTESLLDFKNLMEKNIIPSLKTKVDNSLLRSLVTRSSSFDRTRTWLTTKVSIGKVTNPENGQILFEYQKGMDSLSNEKIKLGDQEFKVDDLLFLYNLIVNKDKPGKDRLTKLFGKYINKNNSFASRFYQYYTQVDNDLNILFQDKTLSKDDRKWIMFGVLNKKGKLNYENPNQDNEYQPNFIKLSNPNLPMSVNVKTVYNNPIRMKQLQDILNLIGDKKLLIDFNCG